MLERLFIKNFALIEEVTVTFCENFSVLTGETGAGKSIMIDAVSVLLGGRAQAEYVRSGTEKAFLEGVFCLPEQCPCADLLSDLGLEDEEPDLVLSREILLNGRNTCRVNGRTVTLGQYRQIGLALVDIHGQHDHQTLLQAEKHLRILDQFGGEEQLRFVKETKERYLFWQAAQKELTGLQSQEQERLQRIDFLRYQVSEIHEAKLKPQEAEELTRESGILANAEKISNSLGKAYHYLFGGEHGISAYDILSKALTSLHEVQRLDPALEKMSEQLEPFLELIQDTALELRNYLENIDYSPQKLDRTEKRLQLIKDLYKKYGFSVAEVLAFAEKARAELEKWEASGLRAEDLEKTVLAARQGYQEKSQILSLKRKELAALLEHKVTVELGELAMPHARFAVSFRESEPTAQGCDEIEFLISPNPGEPLLPVAKIASGGELSRIMLALKTIFAGIDGIGTLIFDEIDAGVGGKAVQRVAEKLEKISQNQQVICVTHSPMVAALADHHYVIEKSVLDGRTSTSLRYLNSAERVDELARMLGGENTTPELKRHVFQILKKS